MCVHVVCLVKSGTNCVLFAVADKFIFLNCTAPSDVGAPLCALRLFPFFLSFCINNRKTGYGWRTYRAIYTVNNTWNLHTSSKKCCWINKRLFFFWKSVRWIKGVWDFLESEYGWGRFCEWFFGRLSWISISKIFFEWDLQVAELSAPSHIHSYKKRIVVDN